MRLVAAGADVDLSQVMQFFRSKDELFAAVMNIPNSALKRMNMIFDGPNDDLGERAVRAFLQAWDGAPAESEPLMAMLRGAMVNEQAHQQLRDYIESRLLTGASERMDSDVRLRGGMALSMRMGLVVSRQIIGVPVLSGADRDTLVAIVAPAIQQVLVPSKRSIQK